MEAMLQSNLPFPVRHGKVRDVYDLGDQLLIVATDRISAFDVVLPDPIPGKGKILTALSVFWFRHFEREIEHHLISTDVRTFPQALQPYKDQLRGRSMLVKKCKVIPIECVARGYLAGSGWKEYSRTQTVCGIKLPPKLRQCDRLPAPIFTPATKEQTGHDINISYEEMIARVGAGLADELREKTLRIYTQAMEYALARGVIIADTKFEFGQLPDGRVILIDEILTPDSSRFWPADEYEPGHDQPSFDKQYVRNWLESRDWDKTPPAPKLPFEVIEGTKRRYLEAYQKLTGATLKL
ncbi:phosphoribosylaminoimidazolesuccinocarboxamide synthase [Fontivita pretiosa]|uniref:phosphoribosylaminoimidazolesuccinocarboxamide synthase n=1 Tax=Fontivita pretiosa TaxID=2989684 RepID=UPI003D17ED16